MITQTELKTLLHYDPDTGAFTRLVNRHKYKAGAIAGYKQPGGYVVMKLEGKLYPVHRLVFLYMTGSFPKDCVDHINMVADDNRWCNLRNATRSQNQYNTKARRVNLLGIKGVYKHQGRFKAQANWKGKSVYLGWFFTKEEANRAYQNFAKANHGAFYAEAR